MQSLTADSFARAFSVQENMAREAGKTEHSTFVEIVKWLTSLSGIGFFIGAFQEHSSQSEREAFAANGENVLSALVNNIRYKGDLGSVIIFLKGGPTLHLRELEGDKLQITMDGKSVTIEDTNLFTIKHNLAKEISANKNHRYSQAASQVANAALIKDSLTLLKRQESNPVLTSSSEVVHFDELLMRQLSTLDETDDEVHFQLEDGTKVWLSQNEDAIDFYIGDQAFQMENTSIEDLRNQLAVKINFNQSHYAKDISQKAFEILNQIRPKSGFQFDQGALNFM